MTTEKGFLLFFFRDNFAELVIANYIFHIDPQIYIQWCYYNRTITTATRLNPCYTYSCAHYYEVSRARIRSQQVPVFKAAIDAKIRAQHRNSARYRNHF